MKRDCFIILLFLLLPPAFSVNDEFFYSESLLLDIRTQSDFTINGEAEWIKTHINYFPEDSFNQEVISITTKPDASYNESFYTFYWDSPKENNHFELNSRVRTYNRFLPVKKKISFPIDVTSEYLQSTEKIDINEAIIIQASKIAEGEDDLYKVVFKLAAWTKDNVNYSLNSVTADASQKASWVLENKFGVCDEITNLFIAMCRSLGIPARFVSGISYTTSDLFDKPWGLHGWAEVYFPGYGWMPFDPTYGQFGFIDGGHVKLKDSLDSDKTSTRYEWLGKSKLESNELDIDVNVIETGKKISDPVEIYLYPYKKEIDLGSYNLIVAEIKNKKDNYIGLELELGGPVEIEIFNKRKYVSLKPNEEKKIAWVIKVSNLDKNYIYTFPLKARNSLGFYHETEFKAKSLSSDINKAAAYVIQKNIEEEESKVYSRNLEFKCSAPSFSYVNVSYKLSCNLKNSGNSILSSVRVCYQNCENIDLGINQEKNLTFVSISQKPGINILTITAKNPLVSKTEDIEILINDFPKLGIANINSPEVLKYENFDISFEVQKIGSEAYNSTIIFLFNSHDTKWNIEKIENNQKFTVSLDKTFIENNNLVNIDVVYHDKFGKEYNEHFERKIEIEDIGWKKILLWLNRISSQIDRKLKIGFEHIGFT